MRHSPVLHAVLLAAIPAEIPEIRTRHCGVPSRSEKHFELIGTSLALLAEVNSRQVRANPSLEFFGNQGGGHPESLVRWVRRPPAGRGTHWAESHMPCGGTFVLRSLPPTPTALPVARDTSGHEAAFGW